MKRNNRYFLVAGILCLIALGLLLTIRLSPRLPIKQSDVIETATIPAAEQNTDQQRPENLSADSEHSDMAGQSVSPPGSGNSQSIQGQELKTSQPSVAQIPTDPSDSRAGLQVPDQDAGKRSSSFPGIKQEIGDVMLAQLQHIPGSGEDTFVATFQRVRGSREFSGSAWLIADYVQRGTTELMAMPSHDELKLATDGTPRNLSAGVRFVIEDAPGVRVSKKFNVKRPGFEGEELAFVRVGIVDRSNKRVNVAKVSASQLNKKRTLKRAKVGAP